MIEAIGALVLVIIGLLFKSGLDKRTIDNQKEKLFKHEKTDEITEGMDKAIKEAEGKKDETIKKLDDISVSDKRSRI